jgi:hypothetical protein
VRCCAELPRHAHASTFEAASWLGSINARCYLVSARSAKGAALLLTIGSIVAMHCANDMRPSDWPTDGKLSSNIVTWICRHLSKRVRMTMASYVMPHLLCCSWSAIFLRCGVDGCSGLLMLLASNVQRKHFSKPCTRLMTRSPKLEALGHFFWDQKSAWCGAIMSSSKVDVEPQLCQHLVSHGQSVQP